MLIYAALALAFAGAVILIIRRWIIPARGFTQLAIFTFSEAAFVCNRGLPCSNCFLSYGICPIGTAQRIAFLAYTPFYISLSVIALTGLVFGSLFCGWACPVGFVQDLLHAPGIREIKITNKFKRIRFFSLILGALLIFLELRFHFLSRRGIGVFHEAVIIIGALILATAIFVKRPFCRILCPLGLFYGKLNKFSPIKVGLNKNKCTSCGLCDKVCITDVRPVDEVNNDLCAKCYNCVKVCRNK